MDGQVGGCLAHHPGHARILHQHRVHTNVAGVGGHLGRAGQLPVGEQGIEGEVDLAPSQMAVRNRRRSFLIREVLRVAAGVEISVSKIDRVGAVLHRGGDRLHGAGGGEKLQHGL